MTCEGNKFCSCLARVRAVSDGTEVSLEPSRLAPLELNLCPLFSRIPQSSQLADKTASRLRMCSLSWGLC